MSFPQESERGTIRRNSIRTIFWLETMLATLATLLAVAAAIRPDWIEQLLGITPDHGNGTVEWQMVLTSSLCALVFAVLAARNQRRLLAA